MNVIRNVLTGFNISQRTAGRRGGITGGPSTPSKKKKKQVKKQKLTATPVIPKQTREVVFLTKAEAKANSVPKKSTLLFQQKRIKTISLPVTASAAQVKEKIGQKFKKRDFVFLKAGARGNSSFHRVPDPNGSELFNQIALPKRRIYVVDSQHAETVPEFDEAVDSDEDSSRSDEPSGRSNEEGSGSHLSGQSDRMTSEQDESGDGDNLTPDVGRPRKHLRLRLSSSSSSSSRQASESPRRSLSRSPSSALSRSPARDSPNRESSPRSLVQSPLRNSSPAMSIDFSHEPYHPGSPLPGPSAEHSFVTDNLPDERSYLERILSLGPHHVFFPLELKKALLQNAHHAVPLVVYLMTNTKEQYDESLIRTLNLQTGALFWVCLKTWPEIKSVREHFDADYDDSIKYIVCVPRESSRILSRVHAKGGNVEHLERDLEQARETCDGIKRNRENMEASRRLIEEQNVAFEESLHKDQQSVATGTSKGGNLGTSSKNKSVAPGTSKDAEMGITEKNQNLVDSTTESLPSPECENVMITQHKTSKKKGKRKSHTTKSKDLKETRRKEAERLRKYYQSMDNKVIYINVDGEVLPFPAAATYRLAYFEVQGGMDTTNFTLRDFKGDIKQPDDIIDGGERLYIQRENNYRDNPFASDDVKLIGDSDAQNDSAATVKMSPTTENHGPPIFTTEMSPTVENDRPANLTTEMSPTTENDRPATLLTENDRPAIFTTENDRPETLTTEMSATTENDRPATLKKTDATDNSVKNIIRQKRYFLKRQKKIKGSDK